MRVALGAARRDVLRLIVGQGLKLAGIGIVLGIAGAFGITPAAQACSTTSRRPIRSASAVRALFLLASRCWPATFRHAGRWRSIRSSR